MLPSLFQLNILFFVPVGMTSLSDNDYQRNVADITHVVFTFLNPFYTASGFFNYLLKVKHLLPHLTQGVRFDAKIPPHWLSRARVSHHIHRITYIKIVSE